MKHKYILFFILSSFYCMSQVGINTSSPNAQLDIRSSNQANPATTDGLLIPKVDIFPTTNPTAAQHGMMVYLTTASGTNLPGFYYWDNNISTWIAVKANEDKDFYKVGTTQAPTEITDNKFTLGNTGFGTNNPLFPLHVEGRAALGRSFNSTGQLTFFPNNGAAWFHFENNNNGRFSLSHGDEPGFDNLMTWHFNGRTGSGTNNPSAKFDIRSSNQATPANTDGLLIPKMDTFPATNPTAAQQGMMVYLTTTSGDNLPGFYYWDNPTTSWKTLNNNGSKYYSVVGTYNASISNTLEIMPQMTITFTPKSSVVFLNFSAKGFIATQSLSSSVPAHCSQGAIFFQILVNGIPNKGWQTNVEDISNVVNYPLWDTAIYYPVNVTPNIPQTVSIYWYYPGCGGLAANYVTAIPSGHQAHRTMTIIDPNGGAGVENSIPPVITEYWNINGNAGTTASNNFIGTVDNSNLHFRRNNINAGYIGLSNTAFGLNSLNPLTSSTNNTAFGSRALIINSSGVSNTAVGYSTLYHNTTGSYNTALGYTAITNENNLTNASAIGAFARADANNTMVLGSVAGINSATETVQVGIGTTLPESRLHVVGNSIVESENVTTLASTYGNLHIGSVNPHGVNIGASISLGGNTSVAGNKRVFGTIEGRKTNFISGSENGYLAFKTLGTGALDERVRITNIGRVGIGTATPGGQFELSLDQGRKPGTATWTIVSDTRLKTVKGSYEKGLEEIVKLNPIVYNYKKGTDRKFEAELLQKPFAGFLAQDVQKIFPEAVGNDEDGFLNLNIHPILIASINAFKDLKRLNDQLIEENKILKSKLDDVVNRLERLEKK